MGFSPESWIHAHAHGVLLAIEIMWVAGFLAIFVFYFMIKRRIKKKKAAAGEKKEPAE
jgi:uncharacterized membrane protein